MQANTQRGGAFEEPINGGPQMSITYLHLTQLNFVQTMPDSTLWPPIRGLIDTVGTQLFSFADEI